MDFRLLGPVEVWSDGHRVDLGPAESAKARCLLAVLLRTPGKLVPTDTVVDRVWGDRPPGAAVRYKYVGWLRTALAPYGIELVQREGGYLLRIDADQVDLHRFQDQTARAERAIRAGDAEAGAALLRSALAQWRGPALAGLPGAWAQLYREHLGQARRDAAVQWFQVELALGHHRDLLTELAEWVAEHRTDERLVELQMLALCRAGRADQALAAYQRATQRIRAGLDSGPAPALRLLYERVRAGDPTLTTASRADAAPRTPPPAHVPPPRQLPGPTRQFTGRPAELAVLTDLLDQLATTEEPLIAVITGMGGVGKTTLAVHWAHRLATHFPDGQLYVNLRGFDPAETPVPSGAAVRGFLHVLGADPAQVPPGEAESAAMYRSLLGARRMLLVLDNVRSADQVRPLLPGGAGCFVLITSRAPLTSLVAVEGAVSVPLDLLPPPDARDLLVRRVGVHRALAEPQAVDELVDRCSGLPLALCIAAARATTRPQLPLAALATQLRDARGRLDTLDAGDATASVRSVFSSSYQILSAPAARLFRLLCLHPGADISAYAASSLAGLPAEAAGRFLDELTTTQLLSERAATRFALHDLLRAYAADRTAVDDSEADRGAAIRRLLDYYLHRAHAAAMLVNTARFPLPLAAPAAGVSLPAPADRAGATEWFAAEHQALLALVRFAAENGHPAYAWQLAWCTADYLHQRGHWYDWAAVQETALAAARELADPAAIARSHQYLGYAKVRLGAYEEADTHLRLALNIFDRLEVAPLRASVHLILAIAAESRRREPVALAEAQRALELLQSAGEPAALANALNSVGYYQALLGSHALAVPYCTEALKLHQELGNLNGEASTWDSLGYAYQNLGRHTEALACYRRAIDLHRELGDRGMLAINLVHLADAHEANGDDEAGVEALRQALELFEELAHTSAGEVRERLRGR